MKTLGIIGGMGPLAGCDLLEKIIANTDARCDQDHIHVLLDSNTAIPDRTAAILAGGADPVPQLCASARRLERAGAQVLVMSCNTVHYFYDAVASSVSVPLLHMPRLTTAFVEQSGCAAWRCWRRTARSVPACIRKHLPDCAAAA